MKRKVRDPDFGVIEVPEPPSREDFERTAREALDASARRRLWPAGSVAPCPRCKRNAFLGRDDLTHSVTRPGAVLIFRHLRGARCNACEAQSLEAADLASVEREAGVAFLADFEAKVSHIGSGTLGTYWPRDVVRNLGLSAQKRAVIQLLDRDTLLIRFKDAPDRPGAPAMEPTPRGRDARTRRRKPAS